MIPSTAKVLNRLGLGISLGTPILVEGPVGCGKTALIEEAAAIAGRNDLLRVHLGDQTDSKILLGSYVCTPTPGVFQWQPGILTTAVVEGRWILIEDIDLAPTEVVAVLLPLLESKTLLIASRGEKLKAKRGFQLFATRTLRTSSRGFSASSGHQQHLGENLWTTIRVRPLPVNEVHSIVRQKFPSLRPFSKTIMRAFHEMEKTYQNGISGSDSAAPGVTGRLLSLRDLMKWCGRMHSVSFQVSQKQSFPANAGDSMGAEDVHLYEREQMFREAVDTFAGMIGKRNIRDAVIMQLGLALGVSQHRVEFYLDSFNPKVDLNDLTFGRVQLGNLRSKKNQTENDRPFAMTIGAVRLLERLAVCVHLKEPVLLVGETGTGKTTCVQNLASVLGRKLVVLNLSQQSDSSDLLGGFRPVDARTLALPLKDKFDDLFSRTFNVKNNAAFIESLKKAESKRNEPRDENDRDHENEAKRQKVSGKFANDVRLAADWSEFTEDVKQFSAQQEQLKNNVLFNFVEGALVRAVRNGDWVLLDEVNLASSETLETLSGLLQGPEGSILLLERGDTRPIHRHPDFRLFACMNPANDAGKKDLPPGLRSRFTEFWVPPPDELRGDLLMIVKRYLQSHLHLLGPRSRGDRLCESIANMYTEAKQLADSHALTDGSGGGKGGGKVHFSVRTLSRALSYAIGVAGTYGLLRGLYEGFLMTFAAHLEHDSAAKMRKLIEQCVLAEVKNVSSFINVIPPPPGTTEANEEQLNGEGYVPEDGRIQRETKTHVLFDCFWLEKGPLPIVDPAAGTGVGSYVLTQSVDQNLRNLARAVMLRRFPVLIQGPTSAGKTSMVEYLAKRTGHRFVRINNHEHTDLQEYIGTYAADSMGRLKALNRLLDDNRELVIPETQEVVRPHPSFMLFATQNPAGGQYGGRKVLSRAFRNRFMELHFGDIPESELETILERRTCIAPSYAKKIVGVFRSLRTDAIYRMKSRAHMFESGGGRGAKSFVTLRDLFRWAGRGAVGYQRLAEDGFMLISERIRRADDRELLKSCIEKEMNVVINEDGMYDVQFYRVLRILELAFLAELDTLLGEAVWTKAMKRLFTLTTLSLIYREPLLLVGDTGCGKTTVCQMLSTILGRVLHIVNAHQHSETADFLGSQRPGNALFEWHDGPLVNAMRNGDLFLLDEISLADDSVIERLNSVLEPQRLLVLAEKSGEGESLVEEIIAADSFHFLATMNPGGDYGKKELSPALRNRFTEIWVPSVSDRGDLEAIINKKLAKYKQLQPFGSPIIDFVEWLSERLRRASDTIISLRDILAWVVFMTANCNNLDPAMAFIHGGCMVLVDGIGVNPLLGVSMAGEGEGTEAGILRRDCLRKLSQLAQVGDLEIEQHRNREVVSDSLRFGVPPFFVEKGSVKASSDQSSFALEAPTTLKNCARVLRALQLRKPVLLEGSPGVGKTSLISKLASATHNQLTRINLSDQTDLADLFGSDLPVEEDDDVNVSRAGEFAWRDGPFLEAMKNGHWVLLDELNLAPQPVLEGLNACLDHRATVYIPELDRSFPCAPGFRVFAAQNPHSQGGGRKGLPRSFANRFTQVYVDPLQFSDLMLICSKQIHGKVRDEDREQVLLTLEKMLKFVLRVHDEVMVRRTFGWKGQPWEFNLRDALRWLELMRRTSVGHLLHPFEFLDMVFVQRMRTEEDRVRMIEIFTEIFQDLEPTVAKEKISRVDLLISPEFVRIGDALIRRNHLQFRFLENSDTCIQLLATQKRSLASVAKSVEMNWLTLLTGPSGSGKTQMVRTLARLCGRRIEEFAMNAGVDTVEILGGFEQVDNMRKQRKALEEVDKCMQLVTRVLLLAQSSAVCSQNQKVSESIMKHLEKFSELRTESQGGRFEWIDGILLKAMEEGNWVLIENVNLCPPSVLDRLNPLFESTPSLMVNERGLVDGEAHTIVPHPDFRLFMTLDPKHGEVSRAMRNRAIEI
ncbi:P-loop containing nucleoside triphosphate hydrolase protein, partial [Cladochytrium replicatum]